MPSRCLRDLFQDGEGAAERVHAAARPLFGFVVDGRLVRLHQPRDSRFARRGRLLAGLVVRFSFAFSFDLALLRVFTLWVSA